MKILILDNDKKRLKKFQERLIGHITCCVETVQETIKKLSEESWDIIYIDHDLGEKINEPSGPGTGYEVAQWLRDNEKHKPAKIIIHSFNIQGSQNIKTLLPEAICNPGAWLNNNMGF
jgi:CheY-like chemotaxis protein